MTGPTATQARLDEAIGSVDRAYQIVAVATRKKRGTTLVEATKARQHLRIALDDLAAARASCETA